MPERQVFLVDVRFLILIEINNC